MTETKLTANLPDLTIELTHRELEDGRGETLTLVMTATSGFGMPLAAWPLLALPSRETASVLPALTGPWSEAFELWRGAVEASMRPWQELWRVALGLRR